MYLSFEIRRILMNQLEGNLNSYFYMSLKALRLLNFEEAINFIDLTIADSAEKEFYMFQKAKILFIANLLPKCALYIEENMVSLYKHCSLYIFSQVLYYYQQSSNCSTSSLQLLLIEKGIPSILADEYVSIFNKEDMDYLEKATKAMEVSDYTTCISYCNLIFKEGTPPISAYLLTGKCHQILGDYDLATVIYKKALKLKPNLTIIYYNLGGIMMECKQYPKAIVHFQLALSLEPKNLAYRSILAETFFKWKKYDSALAHFKKIIVQDPHCMEALLRIADIYTITNFPRKAKKYYKRVLRLQVPNYNSEQNKMPLTCYHTD